MPRSRYRNYSTWDHPTYKEDIHILDPPSVKEETEPTKLSGIICNFPYVNLRNKPSINATPLKTLQSGTRVEIMGVIDDFYQIQFDNVVGYISSKYLREI